MVAQYGLDVVQAYMRHVQDNAEESVRRVITQAEGRRLHAAARQRRADQRRDPRRRREPQRRDRLHRHLARSSTNNFNAPTAVCMAAVLYVFRTLVDDEIPLNAGCLKPLKVIIPERLDAQPASRRPRWSPATSRPRPASPTRSTARSASMALGAGHDEQLHLRQRAPPVLRDDLRRLAAPATGFARHLGRADAHDQLAPHRPRGARVPLSGPPRQLRDPRRARAARPLERRRRRGAAGPLPRADDRLDPFQQPASGRLRCAGRRRRPAGHQPGRARRRQRRAARPHRLDRDGIRATSS